MDRVLIVQPFYHLKCASIVLSHHQLPSTNPIISSIIINRRYNCPPPPLFNFLYFIELNQMEKWQRYRNQGHTTQGWPLKTTTSGETILLWDCRLDMWTLLTVMPPRRSTAEEKDNKEWPGNNGLNK